MLSEAGPWGCLFWVSRQRLCCRPMSEADFDWVTVADPGQQSLCVVAEVRTNAQTIAVLWRKRDGVVLSQDESPMAILSRGECPNPCLDRLLLFFSGLIIYYIECCCLHFRYHQAKENTKCRRERWRANCAPSLGKFIQALEITLKIGNKHLLFQTRAREF